MKKIIIVGGGICGLTTAIAIQEKFKVEIYEAAAEFKPVGAGLVLSANALKAFQVIGIADDVIRAGNIINHFYIKNNHGKILTEASSQKLGTGVGKVGNLSIHRADLHQVLLSQLNDNVKLFTNKQVLSVDNQSNSVMVYFQDKTHAKGDYLLACDGIHSVIRQALVPNATIRYSGYTCWRGVLKHNFDDFDSSIATETWGRDGRFGVVPLTQNRIYWFACINSKIPRNRLFEAFTIEHLQENFRDYHFPIPQSLKLTQQAAVFWDDISDLKPLKKFAYDNILLMGDAGHATTPNMGQGACQAIEDAAVLGQILQSENNVKTAFQTFENRRINRTTKIVNTSWTLGKMAQMTHPIAVHLRNFATRITPKSIAEKQGKFLLEVDF